MDPVLYREAKVLNGPVIEKNNTTGNGACLAETVQSKSRERFLLLFGLIEQVREVAAALQNQIWFGNG